MFQRKRREYEAIEAQLRAERPTPSSDLADDLVRRIESDRVALQPQRPVRRLAIAGIVTASLVGASVALGLVSNGRDSATGSAASATSERTAVAPAATSSTDPAGATSTGSQTARQSVSTSAAPAAAGSVTRSDSTKVAGESTADVAAKATQGAGLSDTRRYLAQLTFEPVIWPGTFPVYICHSTDGSYNNGNGTGRLKADNQTEYAALLAAHLGDSFDKGVYAAQPNCTQDPEPPGP